MTSHIISAARGAPSTNRSGSTHRRGWLLAAVGVLVLGLLTAGVWAFFGLWNSWRAPDDFTRMALPGTLTVQVQELGTQYVYVEHPREQSVPTLEQLGIQITGPGGKSVAVDPTSVTMEYDAPNATVGTLAGTFEATTTGGYALSAEAPSSGMTLAAGESVAHSFTSAMVGAAAVAGVSVLAAGGCFVMASRTPRRSS